MVRLLDEAYMNYCTVVLHADGSAYTVLGAQLYWDTFPVRFPMQNDVHVENKLEICFLLAPVTFVLYLGKMPQDVCWGPVLKQIFEHARPSCTIPIHTTLKLQRMYTEDLMQLDVVEHQGPQWTTDSTPILHGQLFMGFSVQLWSKTTPGLLLLFHVGTMSLFGGLAHSR